jgi:adenine deaminase
MRLSGNIVDVLNSVIYPGTLEVLHGTITGVFRDHRHYDTFIMPGFVDAHVHIESSMLIPSEFARVAVLHGTVATVSDPHEIANVMGMDGITYMVENGKSVPFKFYFGAPSCVPATPFETAGVSLGPMDVGILLRDRTIRYLGEMMNVPGVLAGDPDVMAKIGIARSLGKPIDGHAPGLQGKELETYIRAGITTDHETVTYDEGKEKLSLGMKLLIREGSAAKNLHALAPLISEHPGLCMFCSDDKHPDDLAAGHVNELVKSSLRGGMDLMDVLGCACVNPVVHYHLDVGLLREGDPADFLVIDNLRDFTVHQVYIGGECVADHGKSMMRRVRPALVNRFASQHKSVSDFFVKRRGERLQIIKAMDGQIVTGRSWQTPKTRGTEVVSDPDRDILKIAVVNRYHDAPPAVGFVHGFGLKRGAIAGSVAHDSHNIMAVGAEDEALCRAVNLIIEAKGGIAVACDHGDEILPLPVAGIMTHEDAFDVARRYEQLDGRAKSLGATLRAPFMTLSFMALLVIPALKLSDRGLFDGERYAFTELFGKGRAG